MSFTLEIPDALFAALKRAAEASGTTPIGWIAAHLPDAPEVTQTGAERPTGPIGLDERGVAYIAGTSMKVAYVAVDAYTWGMTPQQIQENYPKLSLSQIHAALAYYHDHQAEIDAQLAAWDEEYEQLRATTPNPLTREQLEERRRRQQEGNAA